MILAFNASYNLEASSGKLWDGGLMEVSSPNINAGTHTDITDVAVGGSFVSGGYVGTIATTDGNPLADPNVNDGTTPEVWSPP